MPHHVIVVGGGFAGLWATRALASDTVTVTLIDRRNHHLFQPLLYQVATAGLSAPDIAAPLRHLLRGQRNCEVVLGDVTGIDAEHKTVSLSDGRKLAYDSLVLASGATHAYFGHEEWSENAPGLKTIEDALDIRRRVLLAFENAEAAQTSQERAACLTFAIVGAGPTGVELAGAIAEIARHTLRDEFRHIDPALARVVLIEAGPRVLPSFTEELSESAKRQLAKLGVEVRLGSAVTAISAEGVRVGETDVPARTVLWAAGVAASPLGKMLGVETDRAGRVPVYPDLSVPAHPDIYAIGDLAAVKQASGAPVPGVAPAAKQMGSHVAKVILARLHGGSTTPFRYKDYGNLATIGRMSAVVDLHGLRMSGLLAWWFWLISHVFFLIGFRNRLTVLMNWAWSYWTYQRHARIIFEDPRSVVTDSRHPTNGSE